MITDWPAGADRSHRERRGCRAGGRLVRHRDRVLRAGRRGCRRCASGSEDLSSPWERVLYGNSAIKRYRGGFFFPSAFSAKSAPPGRHLLCAEAPSRSNQPGRQWRSWAEAKQVIDTIVDYLHDYYADLEDCIEWSSYQNTDPPSIMAWYAKPFYRHPVKVDTIDGLYVASASAEGDGRSETSKPARR